MRKLLNLNKQGINKLRDQIFNFNVVDTKTDV